MEYLVSLGGSGFTVGSQKAKSLAKARSLAIALAARSPESRANRRPVGATVLKMFKGKEGSGEVVAFYAPYAGAVGEWDSEFDMITSPTPSMVHQAAAEPWQLKPHILKALYQLAGRKMPKKVPPPPGYHPPKAARKKKPAKSRRTSAPRGSRPPRPAVDRGPARKKKRTSKKAPAKKKRTSKKSDWRRPSSERKIGGKVFGIGPKGPYFVGPGGIGYVNTPAALAMEEKLKGKKRRRAPAKKRTSKRATSRRTSAPKPTRKTAAKKKRTSKKKVAAKPTKKFFWQDAKGNYGMIAAASSADAKRRLTARGKRGVKVKNRPPAWY